MFIYTFARLWRKWENNRKVKGLLRADFHSLWRGDDLSRFFDFYYGKAWPARNFVVALSLDEGGIAWFHYRIFDNEGDVKAQLECSYIPEDATNRKCPPELLGYPRIDLK